jgi:hypothetical protein
MDVFVEKTADGSARPERHLSNSWLHVNSCTKEVKMSRASFGISQGDWVSTVIPVFVYGCLEDGNTFQELTQTLVVDVRGGIIELESPVTNGLRFLAVNENTNETVGCSVVYNQCRHDGKPKVMIAFDKPSPNFWGIRFLSETQNPDHKSSEPRHFVDVGHHTIQDMYRQLMGRTY